jgi:hypothetical protein
MPQMVGLRFMMHLFVRLTCPVGQYRSVVNQVLARRETHDPDMLNLVTSMPNGDRH